MMIRLRTPLILVINNSYHTLINMLSVIFLLSWCGTLVSMLAFRANIPGFETKKWHMSIAVACFGMI